MKTTKLLLVLLCTLGLMSGCSRADDETKDSTNGEVNKSVDSAKNDAEKAVDDSIDNMMTFFNDQKVKLENIEPVDNMEFAAHEGRSFRMNGKNAYIYRVKTEDENMKKVMKEAQDKGKIKVSIDNTEMEYNAAVNNGYLLLYDPEMQDDSLKQTFTQYESTNPNTLNPNEGTNQEERKKQNETTNDKKPME